ncbi:hypothetical protein SAY87_022401 [Trapa incisa]|uniref:Uncharacterized protein n=1 Tax=Trapa incisa TaxID=236973 RepID=A0AAN7K1S7_9MYRT|nr:hypothetical protein SAY87_022401 [Trapa incisa]
MSSTNLAATMTLVMRRRWTLKELIRGDGWHLDEQVQVDLGHDEAAGAAVRVLVDPLRVVLDRERRPRQFLEGRNLLLRWPAPFDLATSSSGNERKAMSPDIASGFSSSDMVLFE